MHDLDQDQLDQIDRLLSWIPRLEQPGLIFLHSRGPREYPEYDQLVRDFIVDLRAVRWPNFPMEWHYMELVKMADNEFYVEHSGLGQIAFMFAAWEEIEKMLDGHWNRTLSDGTVLRLLKRLAYLRSRHMRVRG